MSSSSKRMQAAFIIIATLFGAIITYVCPFIAVLRGGRIMRTTLLCWGGLVIYLSVLIMGAPLLAGLFDEALASDVAANWVPDGKGVAGIIFIGWVQPLLSAAVGQRAKRLLATRWPAALKRIENFGKKKDLAS